MGPRRGRGRRWAGEGGRRCGIGGQRGWCRGLRRAGGGKDGVELVC